MQIQKNSSVNKRALILMLLFFTFFFILLGRIAFIQAAKEIDGQPLQTLAEERWTKKKVLEGNRGTIYDRGGQEVAKEIVSYNVYAVLDKKYENRVKNPRETAEKLAPIINMSIDRLEDLLSRDRVQVELGPGSKNISHEKKELIESLELSGIMFTQVPRRYYPKQTFASHVLGYTDRDMGEARMGIESSLNDFLKDEDGYIIYQSDRKGFKLPNIDEVIQPPKNGYDVYLTIESNIQMALEQTMTQVEEEYDPERIIAIVADPRTGQILGMSNRPSFNPNQYETITNYTNYAVSSMFEPGSTIKMFTLAAAIDQGVYNGSEQFQSGSYAIGGRRITDHNRGRGWGQISFDEGFQRSSNVAFSIIALEKLGPEKFYEYVERFGFTEKTNIDLPNEGKSLIANSYKIDAATSAFGQATAVTPIQQVQAATAIANGGKMMKPYVIDRIVNSETETIVEFNEPKVVSEPIKEETAQQVLNLLETVVTSPAGTGKPYYIEGYQVAGKTGTAQIPKPDGPGYISGHGQNIFSFLGMAPKDDPRVIVYVAVDRPKLPQHEAGSTPVAKIFNPVMKYSLQYLNISPQYEDRPQGNSEEGIVITEFKGASVATTEEQLKEMGAEVVVIGNGNNVESQIPVAGSKILPGERVVLRTTGDELLMPNIEGWSLRDVMKLAEVVELNPNFVGSGFVVKQSISAGSIIQLGDYLAVELEVPLRPGDLDEEEMLEEEMEGFIQD
ncbi:penicillin-binding protein [Anaerobacillus sp. MEB173]|uniref:penicillin-binding protein n=1 Tax=Anaerobacillus sp. MEB173 TaxID=3383345 RepID=UPI003F913221